MKCPWPASTRRWRSILRVKFQVGLFKKPYPDRALKGNFATAKAAAVNLQAAQESITLVENKRGLLPLKKDAKVLVTGPTANLLKVLNGGWTITWQGDREELYPQEKQTVLEAIQAKLGAGEGGVCTGLRFRQARRSRRRHARRPAE